MDLLPALQAAARELDATVRPDPRGGWTVSAGTPFCTNPNGAPWKAIVTPELGLARVWAAPVAFPWTRRRAAEIAAVRARQLEDLIRSPRKLAPHEREPFEAWTSLPDRAFAFSASVAQAALSMFFVLLAMLLAVLPLMERELGGIFDRIEVQARIGADPLPSRAEIDSLGLGGRLGASLLLAIPIAFFLGGIHAAVHALGGRFLAIARFAPWCALFLLVACLFAFLPRMHPAPAIVGSLLVPAAAILGTTLVWGRRRDRIRDGSSPRAMPWPALAGGAAIILVIVVALVPAPRGNSARVEDTAGFRDRFLLGHGPGRAFARFYYAHTLYGAETVKSAYAEDPEASDRQIRTALAIGDIGRYADDLRAMFFAVERAKDADIAAPLIAKRQHDVYLLDSSVTRPLPQLAELGLLGRTICLQGPVAPREEGLVTVPAIYSEPKDLRNAVALATKLNWAEAMLPELHWEGWTSIFYVGPLFVLILILGVLSLGVGWLYRRYPVRVGHITLAGLFALSVGGLALGIAVNAGPMSRIAEIRNLPPDDQIAIDRLNKFLGDPDAAVRTEAVRQAFRKLKIQTFPRGGMTDALLVGVRDSDVRVRLWSAAALGLTRDERVRGAIHAAMEDPDLLVRYRAAEGLGHIDSARARGSRPPNPESIAKLREMMRKRSWYEGMYALAALRDIDPLKF
jgi:hypothetical protein